MGFSRQHPFPFDLTLEHPDLVKLGFMLAPDAQGSKFVQRKRTGLDGIVPTDYRASQRSPFVERLASFSRLTLGMGSAVDKGEDTKRYERAYRMDWSCGYGFLAPDFPTPYQVGTGPIRDIVDYGYLYLMSGNKVYRSNAANIDAVGDWTEVYDFSGPATPATPTLTLFGADNGVTYTYKVVANNGTYAASAASAAATTTHGPTTLSAADHITVSWVAVAGATKYQVYRTVGGTNQGLIATVTVGTSFDDQGANASAVTPPTVAVDQTPRGFYTGSGPLVVLSDAGDFWYTSDGTTWVQGPAGVQASGFITAQGASYRVTAGGALSWTILSITAATLAQWNNINGGTPGGPGKLFVTQDVVASVGGIGVSAISAQSHDSYRPSPSLGRFDTTASNIPIEGYTPIGSVNGLGGGQNAVWWRDAIYTSYGFDLYRIEVHSQNSASATSVGLNQVLAIPSGIKGIVTSQATLNDWHIFFALWDGTTSFLMKLGAYLTPEEANSPQAAHLDAVHGSLEEWTKQVSVLRTCYTGDPTGNRRLYVGFTDGYITQCALPTYTPYAPADPNCRFALSGWTRAARHDMGFAADTKHYSGGTAFGLVLAHAKHASLSYFVDDGSEVTVFGEIDASGKRIDFADDGGYVQLKVTLTSDSNTYTPVLEGFGLYEQLRPAFLEEFGWTALAHDRVIDRNGQPRRLSGKYLAATLKAMAAKGDDLTLTLPSGEVCEVAIKDYAAALAATNQRGPLEQVLSVTAMRLGTLSGESV